MHLIQYFNYNLRIDKANKINDTLQLSKQQANLEFLFDMIALLAYIQYICQPDSLPQQLLQYFLLLKLFKLKKIVKKIQVNLQLSDISQGYFSLLKLFFFVFSLSHIISCFWIMVSQYSSSYYSNYWIDHYQPENWKVTYIMAMHFILMTMTTVGYGDISPQNPIEISFTLVVMVLICSIIFGYTLNCINQILDDIKKTKVTYLRHKAIIFSYLKKKKVSQTLKKRIMNYFKQLWKNDMLDTVEEEQATVAKLSSALQNELTWQDKGRILNCAPFVGRKFSEKTLTKLISAVNEQHFFPGDIIATSQDQEFALRYIFKGSVNANQYSTKPITIQTLNEDSYFGVEQILKSLPYKLNYESVDFTIIYSLSQKDFLEILSQDKCDYDIFQWLKHSEQITETRKCFSCFETTHKTYQCPLLSYIPNANLIIKKFQSSRPSKRQESFERKNRKLHCMANIRYQQKRLLDLEQSLQDKNEKQKSLNRAERIDLEQESWAKLEMCESFSPKNESRIEQIESYSKKLEIIESANASQIAVNNSGSAINNSGSENSPKQIYYQASMTRTMYQDRKLMDLKLEEDFDKLNKSSYYNIKHNYMEVLKDQSRLKGKKIIGQIKEKRQSYRNLVFLYNQGKK